LLRKLYIYRENLAFLQYIKVNIGLRLFIRLFNGEYLAFKTLKNSVNARNSRLSNNVTTELCDVVGPKFFNRAQKKLSKTVRSPGLYRLKNVIINPRSSAFLSSDGIFVDSYCQNELFDQGLIEINNATKAKIRPNKLKQIQEGFFLAGLGSQNWYHWLIEILPKIMVINDCSTRTILVSQYLIKHETMLDTLKIVLGSNKYDLVVMMDDCNYFVRELYYCEAISYLPYNFIVPRSLKLSDFFYNRSFLVYARERFLEYFRNNIHSKKYENELVYIVRRDHRVPTNQELLIVKLQEYGFKTISIEELNLEEQMSLFQNAKLILGITGAAFANLIFANPMVKFICISPDSEDEIACFSILAEITGAELIYLPYGLTKNVHHYSNDFDVNIEEVMDTIEMTL
jgi:capsular polysaccharide biosynthesis protein